MLPVIAIVGRPNTGKSTLFNRITGTRNALVADRPGVTRDRNYALAEHEGRRFILVDTGGLEDDSADTEAIARLVTAQSMQAVREADAVIWLVDGRAGLTATDEILASQLRPLADRLFLVVNKTEGMDTDVECAEFHALGMGRFHPVSAQRGSGIHALLDDILTPWLDDIAEEPDVEGRPLRITVSGRPNVGKSTLINRLLGEDRVLTFDQPGTTRDSIRIPFERQGKQYELVDTAGVRRAARLSDALEKTSVIMTMKAIEATDIVIAVIDASEALTEQDMHLLGISHDSGKPLIVAVNKWDNLDESQRRLIKAQLERKLGFVDYAVIHFISALHGSGVGNLFTTIDRIGRKLAMKVKSARLTEILEQAVATHPPPSIRGRRIKLRYAHLGGHNPLRVIVHGNQTSRVPDSYTRFLAGYYRKALGLIGTPVLVEFKYGENPYKDRRNVLTERQLRQRRRVIRHARK